MIDQPTPEQPKAQGRKKVATSSVRPRSPRGGWSPGRVSRANHHRANSMRLSSRWVSWGWP